MNFQTSEFRNISIFDVFPPSVEVRGVVSEEGLSDLQADIARRGIINPVAVKVRAEGGYEIVAGYRRYVCAQRLGMREVPCTIRYEDDRESEFTKLAENFKREDVNAYDEGKFYQGLIGNNGLTEKDIAEATNRSAGYIHSRLALIEGDSTLAEACRDGVIGIGVALELGKINDAHKREYYLGWAIQVGATIRLVQQWARDANLDTQVIPPQTVPVTSELAAFQPSRLVYRCELCSEDVEPARVMIMRTCERCKSALLKEIHGGGR